MKDLPYNSKNTSVFGEINNKKKLWNFSSKLALKTGTFIFEVHVFWGVDYESEIRCFGGRPRKTDFYLIFGVIKNMKIKNLLNKNKLTEHNLTKPNQIQPKLVKLESIFTSLKA